MHPYIFTETSEALRSGPLLIQHGIDLILRVRELAESLHQQKTTIN